MKIKPFPQPHCRRFVEARNCAVNFYLDEETAKECAVIAKENAKLLGIMSARVGVVTKVPANTGAISGLWSVVMS